MNYIGKYISIFDQQSNIICSGKIIFQKEKPIKLVSIDNKYFFRIDGNSRYFIQIRDNRIEQITKNNLKEYLSKNFITKPFSFAPFEFAEVYVENDESELDIEIRDLVKTINSLNGISTTGSCSGHNIDNPWIVFKIYDVFALTKLLFVLENNKDVGKEWKISSSLKISHNDISSYPSMMLVGNKKISFIESIDSFIKMLKILNV